MAHKFTNQCSVFEQRVEKLASELGIELHDFADGPPKGDEWLTISFRERLIASSREISQELCNL